MLRRLYTINFIDAFIVGAMTVMVPLLMAEKGVGIAAMGLVFAAAPLAKAAVRLASAAVADSLGDRIIYACFSVSNLLETVAYMLSSTAEGFAAGKLLDGCRESFLWSAIRPSLMAAAPDRKHFAFTDLLSGRFVYNAIGSLAVGALFAFGGFGLPLAVMAALSAYVLASSLRLKNIHKSETHVRLSDFSPFGRSRKFYELAGVFVAGAIFYNAVFYMLLPLYLSSQGFALGEIGLFYAGYFLVQGCMLHLISRHKPTTAQVALAGAGLYCAGMAGVALAPHALIPAFFLLMAFGDAGLAVLWEEMNYLVGRESKKRATDMSVVLLPCFIGIAIASAASGAAVAAWGFAPIFALCAASEVAFGAWCVRLSNMLN
jgi:MFS family permease